MTAARGESSGAGRPSVNVSQFSGSSVLRLTRAKELLAGTDRKSAQIALEVGYNDAHYFSYLFKKNLGLTPGEYRAQNQIEIK